MRAGPLDRNRTSTAIERAERAAWCHFRAPDGTVLEIIGPA
jgi:hypothetical protein